MTSRTAVPSRWSLAWMFARRLVARGMSLGLPQIAGGLAYLSLFAFVPMTLLTLTVLTALPTFGQLRDALQAFLAANLFPATFSDTVVRYVNEFAANAGKLSAMGLALFLATALTTLFTIEKTLNAIWQVEPRRSMIARVGLYWVMLTLAPPLLGGSLALESYFWTVSLSFYDDLRVLKQVSAAVLPWMLTVAGLVMLYRLLPGERVRWKHALAGALLGATVLQAAKLALGKFVSQFTTYTIVYGAFGVLPALLSWLYVLWLAVLLGALIASEARYWGLPWRQANAGLTPGQRFEVARGVLVALARSNAYDGSTGMPAARLTVLFEGRADDARATADLLEAAGYLYRLTPPTTAQDACEIWDERWVLARTAARLTLRPLHDAVWRGEPGAAHGGSAAGAVPAVAELDRSLQAVAGS